ncbi:MAG: tetratricopeptide repeat protein, partial [Pseudomonadota bacterium]
ARVLKKAGASQPHPDLAAAFAEIAPDETPIARLKRFRALTALKPDDPETRMLLAELNIAAEDFPAARRAIGDLAEAHPTVRALTLMAAIERGEGAQDSVVRGWLTRALSAPRGPQWVCDNCHAIHPQWQGICDNCHSLDTLSWVEPPVAQTTLPGSIGMLPLIVGDGADRTIEALPEAEQTTMRNDMVAEDVEAATGGDDAASAPAGTKEDTVTTPPP